jgi:hypothetical protein|tara:strand:- start:353 stop:700 length:348 start_codon:yes stop_codon:yes gene_type:complete
MNYNNDFKYDLKVGQIKEVEVGKMLLGSTIEVKHDLQATKTGNVYIEYFSRGKASGIAKSEADYYCIAFGSGMHFIKTEDLKKLCRPYFNTDRDKAGGDNNTSKGILLPIKDLLK